jgi:hypothetical protein
MRLLIAATLLVMTACAEPTHTADGRPMIRAAPDYALPIDRTGLTPRHVRIVP